MTDLLISYRYIIVFVDSIFKGDTTLLAASFLADRHQALGDSLSRNTDKKNSTGAPSESTARAGIEPVSVCTGTGDRVHVVVGRRLAQRFGISSRLWPWRTQAGAHRRFMANF